MDYFKRINLSFDIRREDDSRVYDILSQVQHKTAYIKKAVLMYEKEGKKCFTDKKLIKESLREILIEMNVSFNEFKVDREERLPEEIFNIFEQL